MNKIFMIVFFLFFWVLPCYANSFLNCPDRTELSHQQGKPWNIPQGWELSSERANEKPDYAEMPVNTEVTRVLVYAGAVKPYIDCSYALEDVQILSIRHMLTANEYGIRDLHWENCTRWIGVLCTCTWVGSGDNCKLSQ